MILFSTKNNELSRLEEDYLVITKKDKLEIIEAKLKAVDKLRKIREESIESSKLFLRKIGAESQPLRYEVRKRNLSEQFEELISLVGETEKGESERGNSLRLQREQLAYVLEETKGKDLNALEVKLAKLKKEYADLQKDLNIEDYGAVDDYLQW